MYFLFFLVVEDMSDKEREMGFLVMDALTLLLNGNSQNAGQYTKLLYAKCAPSIFPLIFFSGNSGT